MAGTCRLTRLGVLGLMLLGLMAAAAGAPALAADAEPAPAGALDAIDSCVRRLNPDVDIGYERVAARCPVLVRRLQESGVAVWLPSDWQRSGNDLSAGGLRELRGLLLRELPVAVPQVRLETRHVGEILAGLTRANDEHSGWWARTRAWLREVFAGNDETADEGWLGRMAGHSGVSQAVLELASYVALALVVLLAVVIVGNELRVGGRLWRLGSRRAVGAVAGAVPGGAVPLDWRGIQESPVAQRLGLLFELVIDRLNERGSVRLAPGLTVRELLRAAPLADDKDRERLGALARASERVRFSGGVVSEAEVAAVMEEGRLLLEGMGNVPGSSAVPSLSGGP